MPSLYIIAGPNGAGKTTFVRDFLRFDFAVFDFLNADEIARGLSPLAPERAQSWAVYDNTENRPLKVAQGDPKNHFVFTPSIFEKLVHEFNLNL
jgi:predicted ABC-type ATPase